MIESYKNKHLEELHKERSSPKIAAAMQPRMLRMLDALDAAATPGAMNIPGYQFHPLKGLTPTRYAISVNGPWRITFEFSGENACRVDFEQYH